LVNVVKIADEDETAVANKFVVVTVPKLPFQRSAEDPSDSVASNEGVRFVEILPETAKFVVVTLVAVALVNVVPASEVVPVTVRFEMRPVVTNKLVEVVFVPVAFVQMKFVNVEGAPPVTVKLANVALVPVRFVIVPLVANRLVVVAFVDVVFVNTPVDGEIDPIVVPLIEPPEIVTFGETNVFAVSDAMNEFKAFMVVPDAVAKPSQPVEVPFVKVKLLIVPFVVEKFVACPFVTNRFVVVTLVPVALPNVKF